MLNSYMQRTQALIYDLKQEIVTPGFLTQWINLARGQTAGEGECIRVMGSLGCTVGQQAYNFSTINVGSPSATGVQGAIHVRTIHYLIASGQKRINSRNWEWFSLYNLNNPVPDSGPPLTWSQYGQGSAGLGSITGAGSASMSSGSFYLYPLPDLSYNLALDCVCYPIALAKDSDPEAIPYLWTDAVPFFAAYLAYLYGQKQDRAQNMLQMYEQFVNRARQFANPDPLKWQSQQSSDPARAQRYGLQQKANSQ